MPATAVVRRDTAMNDSDVSELTTQTNLAHGYWILNAAIALSGVTYSASAFMVLGSGTARFYAASTGAGFTGITVATGNVIVAAAYITSTGGTHAIAVGATAATFGAAALPVVPSTAYHYGTILIKASGASAFTGGTTVLDGTNASAVFVNMNGPAAIAMTVASITLVPG